MTIHGKKGIIHFKENMSGYNRRDVTNTWISHVIHAACDQYVMMSITQMPENESTVHMLIAAAIQILQL